MSPLQSLLDVKDDVSFFLNLFSWKCDDDVVVDSDNRLGDRDEFQKRRLRSEWKSVERACKISVLSSSTSFGNFLMSYVVSG